MRGRPPVGVRAGSGDPPSGVVRPARAQVRVETGQQTADSAGRAVAQGLAARQLRADHDGPFPPRRGCGRSVGRDARGPICDSRPAAGRRRARVGRARSRYSIRTARPASCWPRWACACQSVDAGADLAGYDLLVIGKAALTAEGPAPDLRRVPDGLKVLVFEQTSQALEKRLGFRVQEYGLRNVWPRVAGHPVLAGLDDQHLRDWRGEATILPPRLAYELSDRYNGAPAVRWCGLEVPRLWRCGNRGNVASVLIEKPARGDFLPIVDGGFSLQYSPLLEYREGRGMVLFCQLDVTGRTEDDPAADRLVKNLLGYVSSWKPGPAPPGVVRGRSARAGPLRVRRRVTRDLPGRRADRRSSAGRRSGRRGRCWPSTRRPWPSG